MNVKDVKNIAEAARPYIRAALDAAEELAAIRDAASAKGIDWSQLKALLTAQEKDARDGGESKRVAKIVEKADFASAYADMLGLREHEREKPTRSSDGDPVVTVSTGGASAEMKLSTLGKIAEASATETGRKILQGALAAVSAPPAILAQDMANDGLISQEHADKAAVLTSAMAIRFAGEGEDDDGIPVFLRRKASA